MDISWDLLHSFQSAPRRCNVLLLVQQHVGDLQKYRELWA